MEARFKQFLTEGNSIIKPYDHQIGYLYQSGATVQHIKNSIHTEFGATLSPGEIYRSLSRLNISPYRRKRPHHDDVVYLKDNGFTPKQIANWTGYSPRHIRNIVNKDLGLKDGRGT